MSHLRLQGAYLPILLIVQVCMRGVNESYINTLSMNYSILLVIETLKGLNNYRHSDFSLRDAPMQFWR
jgi:hypothetical protein